MKLRDFALLALLSVCVGFVSTSAGCALSKTKVPTPDTEQARMEELYKVITSADNVITIARSFQTFEISLHDAGKVSAEKHRVYQTAFRDFFAASKEAMTRATDVATPEATRKELALSVMKGAKNLVAVFKGDTSPGLDGFLFALEAVIRIFM